MIMIKELSLPTRESPVSGKATVRVIAQLPFLWAADKTIKKTNFVQKDNNHGRKRNAGSVADKNAVRPKENIDSGVYRLSATKIQTRSDLRSIRSLAQGLSLEQWGNREVSEKRRQFAEADRLVQAAKQNGLFVSKPELHSYGKSTASAQSSGGRLLYMRLRIRKLTHFGVSFSATSYAVLIIHRQCAIVIFLRMNKLRCQYTFCQSFEFGYAVFCLVVFLLIGDVSRNLVNMRD